MDRYLDQAQPYLSLIGRIFLAAIFVMSGWGKVFGFTRTAEMMAGKGLPLASFLLVLTIIIEVAGSLMLLLGWHARWAALALFLWLIPVTLVFHRFWGIDAAQAQGQLIHFMKNTAIMGGMAYVMAFGSGPLSLKRNS
jgi:putative oxidoreductase